jgi:hypothetical protein
MNIMNPKPIELPPDVQLRMITIAQHDLFVKEQGIKELLKLQEQELMLLWGCVAGILVLLVCQRVHINKLVTEGR